MELNIRVQCRGLLSTSHESEETLITTVNDLTVESIKEELDLLKKEGGLLGLRVCSSYHGGPLDYPKMVNSATGLVCARWDICFRRIKDTRQKGREKASEDSDEEVFAEISVNHKGTKSQEDFISTVSESASKLFGHSLALVKDILSKGDVSSLLLVLGGISLLRNKMWAFNQVLNKAFDQIYAQYCRLLDSVCEQVLEYISAMVSTTVLHDPASQDWNGPREFHEGERISHCIRMWGFVLKGYKTDLWATLPPKTAQKMYASIFDESLGILVSRYSAVAPSPKRLPQYRGDIFFMLSTICDALNHIGGVSLNRILLLGMGLPHPQNRILRSIRNKAWTLHQCITTVGAPFEYLKAFLMEGSRKNSHGLKSEMWFLRFWKNDSDPIAILVRTISSHPEPLWPLIVQALFCRNKVLSFTILEGIGDYVPSDEESQHELDCGGVQCNHSCVRENNQGPTSAGYGIMRILSQVVDSESLSKGLFRVLRKSKTSWTECLCGSSIWNMNHKPVWFKGLVHLLEPYLIPVLLDLIDILKSDEPWPVRDVPKALERSIDLLKDCISFIPNSVLKAIQSVDDISNGGGSPLCGSVHIHFIFTSLYGIVTRLQVFMKMDQSPRGALDFVIAYGEALCSLRSSTSIQVLQRLMKDVNEDSDDALVFSSASLERFESEVSCILAEGVANELLGDETGRYALSAVHKFILNNLEWIQQALLGKESLEFKAEADIHGIFRGIDDEEYLSREHDWTSIIQFARDHGNPQMLSRLLKRRHEFTHPEKGSRDDKVVMDIINHLQGI